MLKPEAGIELTEVPAVYSAHGFDVAMAQARDLLLDALVVLQPHREALVVVGAQAVYEHTKDAGNLEVKFRIVGRGAD